VKQILGVMLAVVAAGCATLGQFGALVQPPQFTAVEDQPAEVRVVGPSAGRLLGGADVRLWTRVANPNPFGFTLSTLRGTLYLDDARTATSEFPLGLPLAAGVIPIDLAIDFADVPGLVEVAKRLASRQPVAYRFEGTVGIDAGRLGTPVFGPMTIVRGQIAR
jgi:hypothetical protein